MSIYNLRILLETVEGKKSSYLSVSGSQPSINVPATASFVDTNINLVLSSSQAYNRITGSISCSFENAAIFTGNFQDPFGLTTASFKDNLILSASLSGSFNTGSIVFTSLNTEYDRLLRYKFFGEKVCSTLGLPSNQWVYVDQFRLPADDEANFFEGNVRAENLFVGDQVTFANNSSINSDVVIQIDTGSDRHIKFIDTTGIPTTPIIFGYDVDAHNYELTSGTEDAFSINIGSGSIDVGGTITAKTYIVSSSISYITTSFSEGATIFGDTLDDTHEFTGSLLLTGSIVVSNQGGRNAITSSHFFATSNMKFSAGGVEMLKLSNGSQDVVHIGGISGVDVDTQIEGLNNNYNVFVEGLTDLVGIGTNTPDAKLTVNGDINTNSHITASGNLTVGGDISASGNIFNTQNVQMTNSSSVINTFNTGSHQTCKYTLEVTSGSHIQSSEMLVVQNSSNAFNTEYAQINSSVNLLDFTSKVNDSNVELIGSSSFISCSVKFFRTLI